MSDQSTNGICSGVRRLPRGWEPPHAPPPPAKATTTSTSVVVTARPQIPPPPPPPIQTGPSWAELATGADLMALLSPNPKAQCWRCHSYAVTSGQQAVEIMNFRIQFFEHVRRCSEALAGVGRTTTTPPNAPAHPAQPTPSRIHDGVNQAFEELRSRAEAELRFLEGLLDLEASVASRLGVETARNLMGQVRDRLGLDAIDAASGGLVAGPVGGAA